ncbi:MAG: NUDIX hydrolase [Betaproteobacteria bacterium]|nr:NUDIX hydrolase [Betaproteobacteria bacterium]
MKFCSDCGAPVALLVPEGDNLPRHVCSKCAAIHYSNPKVVVGCVPEWQGQVLLCRRAIEPRLGYWTMPAGFMENGETAREGAARETLEEARSRVEIAELISIISIPNINQVHLMFRGRMLDGGHGSTSESSAVQLFDEADIPWDALAFRTVIHTLRHYLEDRKRGLQGLHIIDLGALSS